MSTPASLTSVTGALSADQLVVVETVREAGEVFFTWHDEVGAELAATPLWRVLCRRRLRLEMRTAFRLSALFYEHARQKYQP